MSSAGPRRGPSHPGRQLGGHQPAVAEAPSVGHEGAVAHGVTWFHGPVTNASFGVKSITSVQVIVITFRLRPAAVVTSVTGPGSSSVNAFASGNSCIAGRVADRAADSNRRVVKRTLISPAS